MPRRAWWGTGNGYSTGRGTGIRVNVLEIEVNTGKCVSLRVNTGKCTSLRVNTGNCTKNSGKYG